VLQAHGGIAAGPPRDRRCRGENLFGGSVTERVHVCGASRLRRTGSQQVGAVFAVSSISSATMAIRAGARSRSGRATPSIDQSMPFDQITDRPQHSRDRVDVAPGRGRSMCNDGANPRGTGLVRSVPRRSVGLRKLRQSATGTRISPERRSVASLQAKGGNPGSGEAFPWPKC
jgi:hypothetical protein